MKQIRVLLVYSLVILLASCGKDKFQTKPVIEIKDYSSDEVGPGGKLVVRFNYFDKEGDLGKGQFTYIRIRTNGTPVPNPAVNDKVDTVTVNIPEFPAKNQGELTLNLDYEFMNEDPNRNDTMYFKVTVRDLDNNTSDTISTKRLTARQL